MGRVEQLTQARDKASVRFLKFMRIHAKNPNILICFFEGEDQKYYGIRLNMVASHISWAGIDCGGKKQVIELAEIILDHAQYRIAHTAFFVDRDFDDSLSAELRRNVYETPCYSIENLYASEDSINRLFAAEFKMDPNDEDAKCYHTSIECFRSRQAEFHEATRPLNCWIKAHRRRERAEGAKHLNLNNINLERIVNIDLTGVAKVLEDDQIATLFQDCYALSQEQLAAELPSLRGKGAHKHFRGKFELEFVRVFLSKLRVAAQDVHSEFHKPDRAIKLNLSKANIVSELSQYADTPGCLVEYITSITGAMPRKE